jgi:hypothetical protein
VFPPSLNALYYHAVCLGTLRISTNSLGQCSCCIAQIRTEPHLNPYLERHCYAIPRGELVTSCYIGLQSLFVALETVQRIFCCWHTPFEYTALLCMNCEDSKDLYCAHGYIFTEIYRQQMAKTRYWSCAFRTCIQAVYSLRKGKFANNICFPPPTSLFVASIHELNKHWDSENLYSSASRVVSMC